MLWFICCNQTSVTVQQSCSSFLEAGVKSNFFKWHLPLQKVYLEKKTRLSWLAFCSHNSCFIVVGYSPQSFVSLFFSASQCILAFLPVTPFQFCSLVFLSHLLTISFTCKSAFFFIKFSPKHQSPLCLCVWVQPIPILHCFKYDNNMGFCEGESEKKHCWDLSSAVAVNRVEKKP